MNKNKQKRIIAVLAVLLALLVVFIFSNSLKNGQHSNEDSGRLAGLLEPIIEKVFGEGKVDVNYLVRKGAHLVEFALLGAFTFLLLRAVTDYSGEKLLFGGLFCTLAVAVLDEYIQSFTGRTSSVEDVLIDFVGALMGMTAAFLFYILVIKRKDRQ